MSAPRSPVRLALALPLAFAFAPCRPASGAPPPPAPAWEPGRTSAVLIGVLEWANPGFAPFPKEGRVDARLAETLTARGVASDRLRFLRDTEATHEACRAALHAAATSAKEGDTLVVYYAGHGWRDRDGKVFFAPYDVDGEDPSTALSVAEIGDVLRQDFHGARLLLLADCCHSGALGRVAESYAAGGAHTGVEVKAGAITSALEDVSSTGAWTFTEAMVAVLSGDAAPDADGDRSVTFAEADAYVRRQMRFRESQPTVARTGGMEPGFVLAKVDPARVAPPLEGGRRVGDFVEFSEGDDWRTGEVRGAAKGRLLLRRPGTRRPGEWVDLARVRAPAALDVRPGQAVEVEWHGRWWPAGVRRTLFDFARVHYDGFGTEWDEWVLPARLRPRP